MIDDVITEPEVVAEGPVDILMRLAATARLYRTSDGHHHARVRVGDRSAMYGLKTVGFRNWLTERYYADCGQPPPPGAIQRVIGLLEARASFDGDMPSAFIRVGREPGGADPAYYLDLADAAGRAVWISAEGWVVVDQPDVHFRRPDGLLALPTPSTDGSIDLLRPYANVTDADFRLLVAWLTAALRPAGPYPILVLYGEQGSAKTTLARILRLLIDPQACPLLAEPRSTRDLMITAVNGWLMAFDNISILRSEMSDSLCRLASGGGFATRSLFSDEERTVIYAQRPVIVNGIEEFVRRGDLIDRCVFLHLAPITPARRRAEDGFWKDFHADYAKILGGVLDAVVGGLRELPSVRLAELPRMADYARWGEAVGRGLGWTAETFMSTYTSNRKQATAPAIEDSVVGTALLANARRFEAWSGTPADLLGKLTRYAEQRVASTIHYGDPVAARKKIAGATAGWPKGPRQFSKELRRVVPQLRLHGLAITFERGNRGCRIAVNYSRPPDEHTVDAIAL